MKLEYIFILIIVFSSCNNNDIHKSSNNQNNHQIKENTEKIPSTVNDNVEVSFDNFIEMFMINENYQINHIKFPLLYHNKKISRKDWKYKPLFSKYNAYFNIISDTTINQKEKFTIINVKKQFVDDYKFIKIKKDWKLIEISKENMKNFDYDFIKFLTKFGTEQEFQKARTKFPYLYIFSNSDKDYETDTIVINKEKWEFIDLNLDIIKCNKIKNTNYRILDISGIENGIAVSFIFKKINGKWFLVEHMDYST